MPFLSSLNISGSALTAQRLRMEIISQNLANANTTRTANGQPYKRKMVVFQAKEDGTSFQSVLKTSVGQESLTGGVKVSAIVEDTDALKPVYDPSHPDANAEGYVMMPNINTAQEMIDMISATRSYEANVTAFNAVKLMAAKALEIGK